MVCGDVVLLDFADIFILICGIAVLKIFWVISMQFSDVILCSFCVVHKPLLPSSRWKSFEVSNTVVSKEKSECS